MSVLLFSNPFLSLPAFPLSSTSSSSCSSPILPLIAHPVSRLKLKSIDQPTKLLPNGVRFQNPSIFGNKTTTFIAKASSDIDGPAAPVVEGSEPPAAEAKEEAVPVEKLPLESKLQERMEQKMRMKMAKKIRLRRKRLVRKRRLRKKGRWPPSKMKKLKNV
uniref:50S ribosomal protein 5ic isoform X1 n=1 Tax=Rhizophora mucronata TaxID=61149 RepID=A0A2P2QLW9_RHIMU